MLHRSGRTLTAETRMASIGPVLHMVKSAKQHKAKEGMMKTLR